jgi:5-methylcytosine-specific restriction endonuclease McrA
MAANDARERRREKHREAARAYYARNKEKVREYQANYRREKPEIVKARKHSYYEANKDSIAEKERARYVADKKRISERNRAYAQANKEKVREYNKAYAASNKAKRREQQKAWREANKERWREQQKAYREANKGKFKAYMVAYYAANAEKIAVKTKAWKQRNADKVRKMFYAASLRRRALLRGQTVPGRDPTPEQLASLIAPGVKCVYCRISQATAVDHFIPIARGGLHVWENLIGACASCNSSKGDKIPDVEWHGPPEHLLRRKAGLKESKAPADPRLSECKGERSGSHGHQSRPSRRGKVRRAARQVR